MILGRSGDKSLVLLLFLVVELVLLYWWTADWSDQAERNSTDIRIPERNRRFAFVSMSTKETSYDHLSMSNKFCKRSVPLLRARND